jgi:hypothetical protein
MKILGMASKVKIEKRPISTVTSITSAGIKFATPRGEIWQLSLEEAGECLDSGKLEVIEV